MPGSSANWTMARHLPKLEQILPQTGSVPPENPSSSSHHGGARGGGGSPKLAVERGPHACNSSGEHIYIYTFWRANGWGGMKIIISTIRGTGLIPPIYLKLQLQLQYILGDSPSWTSFVGGRCENTIICPKWFWDWEFSSYGNRTMQGTMPCFLQITVD